MSGSKTAQPLSTTEPWRLQLGGVGPETQSMYAFNNKPPLTTPEEEFLSTLVTPQLSKSKQGKVEFNELYIPPPPAPHVNEVILKKAKSPMMSRSSSLALSGRDSPRPTIPTITNSSSVPKSKSVAVEQGTVNDDGSKKRMSGNKTKRSPKNKDKEKLLHVKREKYCASGTQLYMIYVQMRYFNVLCRKLCYSSL